MQTQSSPVRVKEDAANIDQGMAFLGLADVFVHSSAPPPSSSVSFLPPFSFNPSSVPYGSLPLPRSHSFLLLFIFYPSLLLLPSFIPRFLFLPPSLFLSVPPSQVPLLTEQLDVALSKLRWCSTGHLLACGDTEGRVHIFEAGEVRTHAVVHVCHHNRHVHFMMAPLLPPHAGSVCPTHRGLGQSSTNTI